SEAHRPIGTHIIGFPDLSGRLVDQARNLAMNIRERRKPSDSARPDVNGSAFDRWFGQMVQNKALPRKSRRELRCHRKMPWINQDVVGEIKFFQHGDTAKKIRLKQESFIRLTLH